jgi:ribonuclease BN (tRNA processing enzyme)
MRVTLLGTGGPRPDLKRMGPSTLVSVDSENLLFDAGRGVAARLVQAGVSITDYGYVFITHLHFDHTGGLADLLFAAWNKARNKTIHVYGPRGTEAMVRHLFEAYERDIWYRLSETELTHEKLVDINEMVKVHDVESGHVFEGSWWRVTAADVDHGHGLGLSRDDWACLAYRVESNGKSVVISGDAVYSPSLVSFAKDADTLVMCCYLSGEEIKDHDTQLIAKYVLASSLEAGKIASEAKVKQIALVHIREKPTRLLEAMGEEIKRDFNGDIIVGEDLLEIDLG